MRMQSSQSEEGRGIIRRWLTSKITIPICRWVVSWWLLLAFAAPVLIGVTGGVVYSKRPIFCTACHEMRFAIQTWRVSPHKNVSCEQCHVMPSISSMIRAKRGDGEKFLYETELGNESKNIQANILNANCEKCHTNIADSIVHHNLKITHRRHLERGIECTFCHDDIVHDPDATTKDILKNTLKNILKMTVCFDCHDGRKASNSCNLCHETFSSKQKDKFSSEWITTHKQAIAKHNAYLKRYLNEEFCKNCHRFATASKISTETSSNKHKQPAHPLGWVKTHPESAKKNPGNCVNCHKEGFCIACHQEKIPASHKDSKWTSIHGRQITQNAESCLACHKSAFCLKCHETKLPPSHDSSWVKRHPTQANIGRKTCETCHTKDYCRNCHGLDMPHPQNWRTRHTSATLKSKQTCQRCHQDDFCTSCHRSSRPKSHTFDWVKTHGSSASNRSACYGCHDERFCESCHATTMPASHKGNWLKTHGKTAVKNTKSCLVCHRTQSCSDCHKVEMPHKPSWLMGHKDSAKSESTACLRCHNSSDCAKCHSAAPASHAGEFKKKHSEQGKASPGLCDLCHGKDSCQKCHGVEMPHPSNFIMEHKKHGASLAQGSPCFKCHEEKYCRMCHPSN